MLRIAPHLQTLLTQAQIIQFRGTQSIDETDRDSIILHRRILEYRMLVELSHPPGIAAGTEEQRLKVVAVRATHARCKAEEGCTAVRL